MRKPIVSKYLKGMDTLTERFKERHDTQNELHKGLQSTLNDLSSQMQAVETLRQTRGPLVTPEAHVLGVGRAATNLKDYAERTKKIVESRFSEAMKGMDSEMASISGLKPGVYAPEIRARFQNMKEVDRVKTLQSLIEAKDGASLDAILNAPPVLTGLLPREIITYRTQFYQTACPDLVKARDLYTDLNAHVTAAIDSVTAATKEYSDPGKLKELEEREAVSSHAQAVLEGGGHGN